MARPFEGSVRVCLHRTLDPLWGGRASAAIIVATNDARRRVADGRLGESQPHSVSVGSLFLVPTPELTLNLRLRVRKGCAHA